MNYIVKLSPSSIQLQLNSRKLFGKSAMPVAETMENFNIKLSMCPRLPNKSENFEEGGRLFEAAKSFARVQIIFILFFSSYKSL